MAGRSFCYWNISKETEGGCAGRQAPRGAKRYGQAGVQMRGMEAAGKIRRGGYQGKAVHRKRAVIFE
ncbi:hypothetical protein B5F54_02840 [Anaeromassilibacillus sp. An250]|nr:hypothetical protein B5F54_02840 [Anaeromassilibacillus sp. An250]